MQAAKIILASLMLVAVSHHSFGQQNFGRSNDDDPGSPSKKCPLCGCNANHCDHAVKGHLDCSLATYGQKTRISDRLFKRNGAVRYALQRITTNCNQFVSDFAKDVGYDGFARVAGAYRTADDMYKFMGDKSEDEGWDNVSSKEAAARANIGLLVIGMLDAKTISAAKHEQQPGHVFIVLGYKGFETENFDVLNASQGSRQPEQTTLNRILSKEVREEAEKQGAMRYYSLRPKN